MELFESAWTRVEGLPEVEDNVASLTEVGTYRLGEELGLDHGARAEVLVPATRTLCQPRAARHGAGAARRGRSAGYGGSAPRSP